MILHKIIRLLLIGCLGIFLNPGFAETQIFEVPQAAAFHRKDLGNGTYSATSEICFSYGCQVLPAFPGYGVTGSYALTNLSTARPAGANTMWGAWTFQSGTLDAQGKPKGDGLFSTNPSAHVAFLMRGVSTGIYNIGGAGYIVGGLGGIVPTTGPGAGQPSHACQTGSPGGEPETWWAMDNATFGNFIWGDWTCSPQLQDYHSYTLNMQATAIGFSWTLSDALTGYLLSTGYLDNSQNPSLPIIEMATGTTIGIVFADAPGTTWNLYITNMAFGWF